MAQPAYKKKIKVSTTGHDGWQDLPATSPSLEFNGEVLDTTDLSTSDTGWRTRILGLNDWSVSCDSNYASANVALQMVRDAKLNRTRLWVQYLPEGTIASGFQGEVVVESFSLSGEVAGLETVGITLQANSALAAAV